MGLGFQPIFIIHGAEPGTVDLDSINYPTSMASKEAAVILLQTSTKPNEKVNASLWKDAVETADFQAERTTLLWPSPLAEDDNATTDSSASVETDGE